jgi:hypothetical protein
MQRQPNFIDRLVFIIVILAILLTFFAVVNAGNDRFSWASLSNAYVQQPPPRPGIVQEGGNALVEPRADGSIAIVSLGQDGRTPVALTLSPEDIARFDSNPSTNTKIGETADGYVSVFRLTTGEFQANIGPDAEGKIYAYIFTVAPPDCVRRYEFSISDATPRFNGPC